MAQDNQPERLTRETAKQIAEQRQRMLTLEFWGSLLRGREGMGETFWAGNYLAGLMFLPIIILIIAVPPLHGLMKPAFLAFGLYLIAVARAVWLAKPKGNSRIGLKIAGVIWTLLNVASVMATTPFTPGN